MSSREELHIKALQATISSLSAQVQALSVGAGFPYSCLSTTLKTPMDMAGSDTVLFDTLDFNAGGDIAYDISSGTVTLNPGRIYKVTFTPAWTHPTNVINAWYLVDLSGNPITSGNQSNDARGGYQSICWQLLVTSSLSFRVGMAYFDGVITLGFGSAQRLWPTLIVESMGAVPF